MMQNLFAALKKWGQRGQGSVASGLVKAATLLIIGLYVFSTIEGTIDHSAISSTASTKINTTASTTYNAFGLAVVGLIVMAAAAVMRLLGYL